MKNILGQRQRPILERFLQPNTLLAFDFDGTLAPIVEDPSAAAMRPRTRQLLEKLAARFPCTVISGRVRKDVRVRVRGISLREVFGNHGMEPLSNPQRIRALVRRWKARLRPLLLGTPGLVVEDKGVSLAVHYRLASRRVRARRLVLAAIETLPGKRIIEGKMIVNVLPARADDKASALTRLRRRLGSPMAIYVGDDENDEGVFSLFREGWLLGIRICRSSKSQAQYFLQSQRAIDALLRELLLRTKPPAPMPRT